MSFTECTLPACCIPCKDSFWKLAQCLWQIYFHMHTFRSISPLSKRRENDARDRHAQMVHPVPLALIRHSCRMSLWHKRLLSGRYEHFTCHACCKYIRHSTLFAKVRSCLCRAYCRRRQCASYKRHRQLTRPKGQGFRKSPRVALAAEGRWVEAEQGRQGRGPGEPGRWRARTDGERVWGREAKTEDPKVLRQITFVPTG